MCCKRSHFIFSTFPLKSKCKICVQKEIIHNFKNHILVTWPGTNLLILRKWCGFEKPKSLLCCFKYDPLIVFRRQNHITFIFMKTMSHDLLVQMACSHEHFYLSAQSVANYIATNFQLSTVTEFPPNSLVVKPVWAGTLFGKIIETVCLFSRIREDLYSLCLKKMMFHVVHHFTKKILSVALWIRLEKEQCKGFHAGKKRKKIQGGTVIESVIW